MDIEIVQWAAEECYRQSSGELSVAHLCEAWLVLASRSIKNDEITPELIIELGALVEPHHNARGYRNVPAWIRNHRHQIIGHENIKYQIETLCEYTNVMSAVDWYYNFQKIHPFIDGNGRVGTLLFNFLSGTLYVPIVPPDLFAEAPPCM